MREATKEELEGVDQYIKSISKSTGIDFFDISQKQVLSKSCNISGSSYETFYEDIDSDFQK